MRILLTTTSFTDTPGEHQEKLKSLNYKIDILRGPLKEEILLPLIDNPKIKIANLYKEIKSISQFEDPNEVKVIIDQESDAIYFSREPIPSRKKGHLTVPMYKQICSIPFRRNFY